MTGYRFDLSGPLYVGACHANGNFSALLPFVWESTGHRWIPLTKASDAELWWFLWFASEQTTEQTIEIDKNAIGMQISGEFH